MPTLNWIGKEKIITHHQDVPFHVLEHKYGFTAEGGNQEAETHSGNMIIHGDNLVALKALLPIYEGRVDCIYIDPPYNTGEEKWIYNDNVNDPHIKKWLNEVVGKQGEDLSRHDKWLCMMYPRLVLLKKLLTENGIIFISIDDNECYNLKNICDVIFGSQNFIANFIWEKRKNRENRKVVSTRHDYILCYSNNKKGKERYLNLLSMTEEALSRYSNPDNDPNGIWKSDPLTAQAGHATEGQFYTLVAPNGNTFVPPAGRCWIYTEDIMRKEIYEKHIWFGEDGNNVPRKKTYFFDKERGLVPETMWFADEIGTTESAKNRIKQIFDKESPFETPKPIELIERILQIATNDTSIILDSFAGSGVTAHAVLKMNRENKASHRHFILVEMMDYAETITAERVRRAATGYAFKGKKEEEIYSKKLTPKNILQAEKLIEEANAAADEKRDKYDKVGKPKIEDNCLKVIGTKIYDGEMPGLGGAFDYYELGERLFDDDGFLNENVGTDKIRQYIYYSETGEPQQEGCHTLSPYLLGCHNKTDYYFYYDPQTETCFCPETADLIVRRAEQYIVYADTCLFSKEELSRQNVIFKKIPRDIKKL